MNPIYLDTARLLAQVAPLVFVDDTFALKGGTAINLFVRDMPRLSVDLDLVFPDHALPRERRWQAFKKAMREAAQRLTRRGFAVHIPEADVGETKLLVRRDRIEVKVEANFVMRGTVLQLGALRLRPFTRSAAGRCGNPGGFAAGRHVRRQAHAALDRQHPRDLFDVMQLYGNEGITPGIRRTFVVYLCCGKRPIHELLFPQLRDIRRDYTNNFRGMTAASQWQYEVLVAVRDDWCGRSKAGTGWQ